MIGYVRPDIRARGVESRLYARALVLEYDDRKLALVSADMLYGIEKEDVVERVRDLGFSRENVVYSGTHTHAAPDASDWTVDRVADAVRRADEGREPAVAAWGQATVEDVGRNRSVEAHLANHGMDLERGEGEPEMDPMGAEHTVDRSVRLLRVEDEDGRPVAAWTRFSVHPTCFPPDNHLYSADLAGTAGHHFRLGLGYDGADGRSGDGGDGLVDAPVVLFANGGHGDQIPRYDGVNAHEVADRLGRRLSRGYLDAWEDAEDGLSSELELAATARDVEYRGQEVEDGKRVASRPVFGVPFLGGGENGPSFLYGLGLEGRRRPARLAGEVHGRKIPVAPAHWGPEVEVQVVRVGDVGLFTVPGEPTVEMTRRTREEALEALPDEVADAAVLGVTNGYNGYFTTPEEYDQQHYEGGHTVFGKHSEALLRKTHADLARRLGEDEDTGGEASGSGSASMETGGAAPPVTTGSEGELRSQPPVEFERFDVVEFEWEGGRRGRDRQVDEPFVLLQRREGDGWTSVASDLEPGLIWTCRRGRYRARYEAPRDVEPGVYRFQVEAGGYGLTTHEMEVSACDSLSLLGVEVEDEGSRAVFHARNPPPDHDEVLRCREVTPRGGRVEFEVDGADRFAEFDGNRGAWVADVEDVEDPRELGTLRSCRLVDDAGNSSGDPVDLEVGVVDDVDWPSYMEVGGGKPPGPFGFGTWPI